MEKTAKKSVIITRAEQVQEDIFSMCIQDKDMANLAKPGQFLSLYCKDGSRLLPRPISICEIDKEHGTLRLVYRVVGKGTKEFAGLHAGASIDALGPLGNGFTIEGSKAIVIGGGIGIPPMLELAKTLHKQNIEVQVVLGYRDILFLNNEFTPYGKVYISTEDGSQGTKGNVIDAIRENKLEADVIYACGPTPMLKGVKTFGLENGITTQLSLEERMACGVGACLGCVVKTTEINPKTQVYNKRVCKDGPVFYAQEVEL